MSKEISDEFGSFSLVPIKNEESTEGKSLPLKQSMDRTWQWSPIEGLFCDESIEKKNDFIRQEIARMTIYPEPGVDPALRRKKGIVIGVARAVSTEIYEITDADLIVEEMDSAKLAMGVDGETIEIKNDVDSKWKEELSKPLNLSEIENKVIEKLFFLAHAVIPLQGYCLVRTSNPNDERSKRSFYTVEKQFFMRFEHFSWWKEDEEALRDAMWNKAGRPVNISFKRKIACSSTIRQFLTNAGVLSAAPRFPAVENVVRIAKLYRDLLKSLSHIFNDEVMWQDLDELLSHLENFSTARSTEVVTVHNAPIHLRSLDTREKVVDWLEHWCSKNAKQVAICYGFRMAMGEKAMKLDESPHLTYAIPLSTLMKTNVSSYMLGRDLFSDFKNKFRQLMNDAIVP